MNEEAAENGGRTQGKLVEDKEVAEDGKDCHERRTRKQKKIERKEKK